MTTSKFGMVLVFFFTSLRAWGQVGLSPDELKLFHLVNQERKTAGLPEFHWDNQLAKAALAHAQLLANHQQLTHQFTGEAALGDRIGATGLRFDSASENVVSAPTLEELHQGLMSSALHRANILNEKYNAIGLGIVPVNGELYVAQNFARVLPVYSEEQFRNAVIAAFNKARLANNLKEALARPDAKLHDAACAENSNGQMLLNERPGAADLNIFTSSVPEKLSPGMQKAAGDATFRNMNVEVCFRPSNERGYGSFRVITVFYRAQ